MTGAVSVIRRKPRSLSDSSAFGPRRISFLRPLLGFADSCSVSPGLVARHRTFGPAGRVPVWPRTSERDQGIAHGVESTPVRQRAFTAAATATPQYAQCDPVARNENAWCQRETSLAK